MHPTRIIQAVQEDPDDDLIVECAVENVSDFIISYDKDLLRRRRIEGIPVVQVETFLRQGLSISGQFR